MGSTAEFRILSEDTDPLADIISVIYRDVKQFGKVSVLTSDAALLEQVSELLWQNAKEQFVTYQFASVDGSANVQVSLCDEIRHLKNAPALCNINYLLEPSDIRFRHITEIVLPSSETVDKARRQYKMYRSAGLQVTHLEC